MTLFDETTPTPAGLRPPSEPGALAPHVWPRSIGRSADGAITLDGLPLARIARTQQTPAYVIDLDEVRARTHEAVAAFGSATAAVGTSAHVYYAGKALLTVDVARLVHAAGARIDVCSLGELEVALAAGVPAAALGLHGNSKSDAELERAVAAGVGSIVIDAPDEVRRVASFAARAGLVQPVRLRVNSGVHASTHSYLATAGEDQKFGVPLDGVEGIAAAIRAEPSLRFLGLHSHIGSQIVSTDGFAEAARRLLDVHERLLTGGEVPELNLGGGFGIAYTPADEAIDFERISRELAGIVTEGCKARGIAVPVLCCEPGRSIVGPAGITLYEVGTVKPVAIGDAGEERLYVSVDGGMSDNPRPALYGAEYDATLANRSSSAPPRLARVVGKHCESGDVVVPNVWLPGDVRRGDLIAVAATGAYCFSLASTYNVTPRPPLIGIEAGRERTLVRRITIHDLLSFDAGRSQAPAIGTPLADPRLAADARRAEEARA